MIIGLGSVTRPRRGPGCCRDWVKYEMMGIVFSIQTSRNTIFSFSLFKVPTSTFYLLKVPTSTFTLQNLSKHNYTIYNGFFFSIEGFVANFDVDQSMSILEHSSCGAAWAWTGDWGRRK